MKKIKKLSKIMIVNALCFGVLCFISPSSSFAMPVLFSNCELDAPQNIHTLEVGPTWISMAWDPVQYAEEYEIHIIDVKENIVKAVFFTPGSTFTVEHLLQGETYSFQVAARCMDNGILNTSSNFGLSPDNITLIIDLIGVSYTPDIAPAPNSTVLYNFISGNNFQCYVNSQITSEVFGEFYREGKYSRFFLKSYFPNEDYIEINRVGQFPESNTKFSSEKYVGVNNLEKENGTPLVDCIIDNLDVFRIIPEINHSSNGITIHINRIAYSQNNYGFRLVYNNIQKTHSDMKLAPDSLGISNNIFKTGLNYTNPFKDILSIKFPNQLDENLLVKVYCLNNNLLLNTNIPIGSTSFDIPLEYLPKGVYVVSLQGKVNFKAFRVIKI